MHLLVHADASRQWEPAATLAARIARATEARITVVTAERVKRRQAEVRRRAEQVIGLPEGRLAVHIEPGLVEQVVPKVANGGDFDLLLLSPLGGLDLLTHGHILSRLVAHSRPSTLLVRGNHGQGFSKSLLATEGGPHGMVNLDAALALASIFDMEVHTLHVLSQIAIYDHLKEQPHQDFVDSDHPSARHLRACRMATMRAGVRGEAKVRVGPVQDEVLHELKQGGYDLLIIGAHSEDPTEHFLTRDIAAWLLRHCPVSTLVVRERWRLPAAMRPDEGPR